MLLMPMLNPFEPIIFVLPVAISQVLRKQAGIQTKDDHDAALADYDYYFEMGSRHLSYLFRYTNLLHEDGSLSLNELLYHHGTARKIRSMYRECSRSLTKINEDEVPISLRDRNNTMRFLMPLAHVVCDSKKSRAMIGYLTTDDFEPGKTPDPNSWFVPADFDNDASRIGQADVLDGIDIASMFIRFESGHSNTVSIQHCPFMPDMFSLRCLVHGTNEKIFRLFGVSACFQVVLVAAVITFILPWTRCLAQ